LNQSPSQDATSPIHMCRKFRLPRRRPANETSGPPVLLPVRDKARAGRNYWAGGGAAPAVAFTRWIIKGVMSTRSEIISTTPGTRLRIRSKPISSRTCSKTGCSTVSISTSPSSCIFCPWRCLSSRRRSTPVAGRRTRTA